MILHEPDDDNPKMFVPGEFKEFKEEDETKISAMISEHDGRFDTGHQPGFDEDEDKTVNTIENENYFIANEQQLGVNNQL